jgi:DNA-binding CsgD family transcriptional regulator
MERDVPLETFQPFATVLTNGWGDVAYCNQRAVKLLGFEACEMVGRRCWDALGLVDSAGTPFCNANCPVQGQARRGRLTPRHRVISFSESRAPLDLELLTFVVPPRKSGRQPILHLLLPATIEVVTARSAPDRLGRLSSREAEILNLLASGHDTAMIAARLSISASTVRNHVQHILAKLGVHDRLQAILTLFQNHRSRAE